MNDSLVNTKIKKQVLTQGKKYKAGNRHRCCFKEISSNIAPKCRTRFQLKWYICYSNLWTVLGIWLVLEHHQNIVYENIEHILKFRSQDLNVNYLYLRFYYRCCSLHNFTLPTCVGTFSCINSCRDIDKHQVLQGIVIRFMIWLL